MYTCVYTGGSNDDLKSLIPFSTFPTRIPLHLEKVHVICNGKPVKILWIFFFALENAAIQDQVLRGSKPWAFQSRIEQYETALQMYIYMMNKLDEMGVTDPLERMYYQELV